MVLVRTAASNHGCANLAFLIDGPSWSHGQARGFDRSPARIALAARPGLREEFSRANSTMPQVVTEPA
jgi:hypothetical protein